MRILVNTCIISQRGVYFKEEYYKFKIRSVFCTLRPLKKTRCGRRIQKYISLLKYMYTDPLGLEGAKLLLYKLAV